MKAIALVLALLAPIALAAAVAAGADGGCVITPTGIDCSAEGTSSTSGGTPGTTIPAPPLRYLATTEHPDDGLCWFWSPYPPGLDSWDPANDMEILWTRWALPECPDADPAHRDPGHLVGGDPGLGGVPLVPPGRPAPLPAAGAARHHRPPLLPGRPLPAPLAHREVLPDGRALEVEARVTAAVVDWGDGSPALAYDPATLLPYPAGRARHTYALKTCPADYRASHPSGGNCHPRLEAYPISGHLPLDGALPPRGRLDRPGPPRPGRRWWPTTSTR